ncbi:uncharacterized protein K452DRAFT_273862 [Aplosporella prunicola CBS 121167]|uniref:UBX domain-containing protein n=1 Tax=Aplosporella prunicola CBS 121167 TaxID=1176127 RepID=A0A6A6BBE9_9PEZI|nr:uncharacterized protein K452DRAFT_273862 [Aplosporella prunicola CBS 121167]KAF2140237.1 hypothetical protein K452DRAFT_273862 [Aplosporella prunicola CBS 121167]
MTEPTGAARDEAISDFCSVTGVGPDQAQGALQAADWDVASAITLFYSQDEATSASPAEPAVPADYTGPRTLSGAPAPQAAASSSRSSGAGQAPRRAGAGGLRTLKDVQNESAAQGHGHDHDDDDSDEEQDFFAGGEKSGLAVQNPNTGGNNSRGNSSRSTNARDFTDQIIDRARRNAPRPGGGDDDEQPRSRFSGQGQTLGGDDAPSRVIPDPGANQPRRQERVRRVMHLWRDGFSIDEGRLYRYDDPANAGLLEMINQGRAPLDILNVEQNQEVDLEVHPHKDEDYVQPKPKYKPFSGQGQRLGSPTPGASSSASAAAPAAAASAQSASSSSATPAAAQVQVDDAQPTLLMQIRLGDGTRLQSRFNTTHTVGDLYGFVDASSPASRQREYALMTTFPSKELNERAQVLGDMAEFKRGGVVVQKWK